MTAFKDLNEFYSPGLILPIGGVQYTIKPPSAVYGLWLQQMVVTGAMIEQASDDADRIIEQVETLGPPPDGKSVPEIILGDAYQQMQDNGVDLMRIKHCANTALIWITMGEDAAVRYWPTAGAKHPGKAPNRAGRRQTSKSTAAAKKTRKAASTSGTSSPMTSSPAPASSSPGTTS